MTNDDGIKITIRISPEEIQAMEEYMDAHDIENRSDFVRDAIRSYITSSNSAEVADDDSIVVHLNPVVLQTLENMRADGTIFDAESYVRALVMADIIPQDAIKDSKARSFSAAQQSSRIM